MDIFERLREMTIVGIEHDHPDDILFIKVRTTTGDFRFSASNEFAEALLNDLREELGREPFGRIDEDEIADIREGINNAIRKIEDSVYEDVQTEELEETIGCETSVCDRKGG